jgi:predicted MPP superfamily phosphohydrolase
MRSVYFLIFFGVVFLVYFSVNSYIFTRGLQTIGLIPGFRRAFIISFWAVVSTFIIGEILEHTHPGIISEWIYRIGAFWLAFMLYLFLIILFIDIIRLADHFFHFLPATSNLQRIYTGLVVLASVALIVIVGHWNALSTRLREINLTIPKTVKGEPHMKVLMVSDIHLGALFGDHLEGQLLRIIKNQNPDLVVLCGDIVDGDIGEVLRKNLGRHIQEIKTPMGVYAIPGNHEYIGGIHRTLPYLRSININVLRDQVINLPNGVQLVGRDDRDRNIMGDGQRKTLAELMKGVDRSLPVIVLNHQPFNLGEAEQEQVDLHLSGHTHDGQMWPLNFMTEAIFEKSWGYLKKGTSNFYVSSGFGTWGPPVRIGNTPEVVVFNLDFK